MIFKSTPPLTLSPERPATDASNPKSKPLPCFQGMSVAPVSEAFPLLSLPNPLILCISDWLDYRSISNFAITCKRINKLVSGNMITRACIRDGAQKIPDNIWRGNEILSEYLINNGYWETLGTEDKNGCEYTTKCKEILAAYSYSERFHNYIVSCHIWGMLQDNSKFLFSGEFERVDRDQLKSTHIMGYYSGDVDACGVMKISPNWEDLITEMHDNELRTFVEGIHSSHRKPLFTLLNSSVNNHDQQKKILIKYLQNSPF